jgi:hypothetical protein
MMLCVRCMREHYSQYADRHGAASNLLVTYVLVVYDVSIWIALCESDG